MGCWEAQCSFLDLLGDRPRDRPAQVKLTSKFCHRGTVSWLCGDSFQSAAGDRSLLVAPAMLGFPAPASAGGCGPAHAAVTATLLQNVSGEWKGK